MRPGAGVLDTSVIVQLDQFDKDADLPEDPLISAVTLAELSVGPLVTDDEAERAIRQARLQVTEATFDPIPFDAAAARAFGQVAAELRRSGRKRTARSFDAMIAATALARGLPVFTANPEDFMGISGLEIISVAAH
jgi:tRNA(fMet)-specific endonuclease VapC